MLGDGRERVPLLHHVGLLAAAGTEAPPSGQWLVPASPSGVGDGLGVAVGVGVGDGVAVGVGLAAGETVGADEGELEDAGAGPASPSTKPLATATPPMPSATPAAPMARSGPVGARRARPAMPRQAGSGARTIRVETRPSTIPERAGRRPPLRVACAR